MAVPFDTLKPARQLEAAEFEAKQAGDMAAAIKLRLDPDIVAAFRATGEGWQTRINDVLLLAVKTLR